MSNFLLDFKDLIKGMIQSTNISEAIVFRNESITIDRGIIIISKKFD